jgi:hypothetical protein
VVSDLACFNELVREGDTGLVFDHRGVGAEDRLAATLARLLVDAKLRRELAQRAQNHVRQYDYPESARAVLAQLAKLSARSTASA